MEHKYLFHALRVFGFGEWFMQWIKMLYADNEPTAIHNGHTSNWFCPKKEMMQECPISGMLFTLSDELISIRIWNSEKNYRYSDK